jgi:hypothetical protein
MAAHYYWRQAGTTGRAHLVRRLNHRPDPSGPVCGSYAAPISECGMVRDAAWVPAGRATRCGLCRRLERRRKERERRAPQDSAFAKAEAQS